MKKTFFIVPALVLAILLQPRHAQASLFGSIKDSITSIFSSNSSKKTPTPRPTAKSTARPTATPTPSHTPTPSPTASPIPGFADLVSESVTFNDSTGYIKFTVKNQGSVTAVPACKFAYSWLRADGSVISTGSNYFSGNIPAGQTQSLTLNGQSISEPVSTRKIKLTVNPDFAIPEASTNRENNTKVFDRPLPDLVIDDFTFDAQDQVTAIIKNQGTARANANANLKVALKWLKPDDSQAGQVVSKPISGSIDVGRTATISFAGTLPPAEAGKARVTADGEGVIRETDESNNHKIKSLTNLPDLIASGINFDQNKDYPIVTVANKGTKTASGGFKVQFKWTKADMTTVGSNYEVTFPDSIPPGAVAQAPASGNANPPSAWLPPATAVNISVDVNHGALIAESKTDNNSGFYPRPAAGVDLITDSVSYDPSTGIVIPHIKNIGTGKFPSDKGFNIEITWIRSDGQLSIRTKLGYVIFHQTIEPGQIVTPDIKSAYDDSGKIRYGYTPPNDAVKARVVVDVARAVSETNEDNNSTDFSRTALPDLTIDSIAFDPTYGYSIPTVKNQGQAKVYDKFKVTQIWMLANGFHLGVPATIEFPGNLGPGESQTPVPVAVGQQPPGSWIPHPASTKVQDIIFSVDVADSNTGNNEKTVDRPSASSPSPSVSPVATASPASTPTPTPSSVMMKVEPSVSPSSATSPSTDEITYPIAKLGNCATKEECKAYCDKKENLSVCAAFGEESGLMTKQEAETANKIGKITHGPGQCKDRTECEMFCDAPENMKVCLDYAEKNNLISTEELANARKVASSIVNGGKTPGNCRTPNECKNYCEGSAHNDECISFAVSAGIISGEEGETAQKMMSMFKGTGGPGGCKNKEQCEAYCNNNHEECDTFFQKAGINLGGPKQGKVGPGGCKGKEECDAYCTAHPGACEGDGGNGPIGTGPQNGGKPVCTTRDECEKFCQDPANKEACKNVVISEASAGPEITGDLGALRANIEQMPSEAQDCVKNAIGEESFNKLMSGGMPDKPLTGDIMEPCFEQGVITHDQLEMQNRPLPEGEFPGSAPPPEEYSGPEYTDGGSGSVGEQGDGEGQEGGGGTGGESSETNPQVQGISSSRVSWFDTVWKWFAR